MVATQDEIGAHLDLTDRSVRQLMADGVIPQAARGEHDLDACRVAYIRHLRAGAAGHVGADGKLNLVDERAKLAAEQTEKLKLENAVTKGELIRRDDYLAGALVIASTIRTQVLALGAKIQHKLAGESDPRECRKIVEEGAREALDELSRLEVVGGEAAENVEPCDPA